MRLTLVLLLLAAGCSGPDPIAPVGGGAGGGGGSGAGGGSAGGSGGGVAIVPLTVDEYCAEYGVNTCPYLAACSVYSDVTRCEAFYKTLDYCVAWRAALKDGRVAFDGTLARQCVAYIRSQTQCTVGWSPTTLDCTTVFRGLVADGSSCFDHKECGAASYCSNLKLQCPASCAPRRTAGQTAEAWEGCASGLYLYGTECRAFAAAGAACAPLAPVPYNQSCVTGFGCNGATCVRRPLLGEACTAQLGCFYSNCIGGTCRRWARPGEPCNLTQVGHPHCVQDAICAGANAAGDGICKPPQAAGAPCESDWECDRTAGLICMPGATAKSCQPRKSLGAACTYSFECAAALYCSRTAPTTCIARVGVGQSCASTSDACLDGLWCNTAAATTCAARRPAGSACTDGFQCQTQQCVSDACTAPACADPTP